MKMLACASVAAIAALSTAHAQNLDSWTGPYVGAFSGVATGDWEFDSGPGNNLDASGGGLLTGVQAGYDWQFNPVVVGAVTDIAITTVESEFDGTLGGAPSRASSELDYVGTVRGRVGLPFDNLLVYTHGGFAYGRTSQDASGAGFAPFSGDSGKHGWVAGVGVEYLMADNVSFQTEYGYYDLGDNDVFTGGGVTVNEDLSFHALRAGVNLRF